MLKPSSRTGCFSAAFAKIFHELYFLPASKGRIRRSACRLQTQTFGHISSGLFSRREWVKISVLKSFESTQIMFAFFLYFSLFTGVLEEKKLKRRSWSSLSYSLAPLLCYLQLKLAQKCIFKPFCEYFDTKEATFVKQSQQNTELDRNPLAMSP